MMEYIVDVTGQELCVIELFKELEASSLGSKLDPLTPLRVTTDQDENPVSAILNTTSTEFVQAESDAFVALVAAHDGPRWNWVSDQDSQYLKRRIDGEAYYDHYRSEAQYDIINNNITLEDQLQLDAETIEISAQVRTGDWYSAYQICVATPTSTVFTQAVKDALCDDIKNYVNANYEPMFHIA